MNGFISFIVSLFFPEKCPYCQKVVSHGEPACSTCMKKFSKEPYLNYIKSDCYKEFLCISALQYYGDVKEAIWRYKFRNYKDYAHKFAMITALAMKDWLKSTDLELIQLDYITSVPLSCERLKQRGYDQSRLLAKNIANCLGLKYAETLLKVKHNQEQHRLSVNERRLNVKGVYSFLDSAIIKDKKILVCDDIITTGNTLNECAETLMKAGAEKVFCLTLAVTPEKEQGGK